MRAARVPAQRPAVSSTNAVMVFARVALLLAGGAAVKFVLALQDEDDAARAGDARGATEAPVDRRLGWVRPAVSRREPAADATAEAALGPVAVAEPAPSPDSTGPGVLALTPPAAEAEETRSVDDTSAEVATVASDATERTDPDPETRSTGPPAALAREPVGAPLEPESERVRPPPRVAVRAVTFASPEPSPAAASSERSLVSDERDSERRTDSEEDSEDESEEDDAVASRIAAEYLASLPFVPPPGTEFPETPGAGLRRPAVCASPFIAADGARRVVRGEGGKGNLVRRRADGGAAPRLMTHTEDPAEDLVARTPGGTRAARQTGYPKTPGPTLEDENETFFEDEEEGDENENQPQASPPSEEVKLHVSLLDLKGRRGGVGDSRERYQASPLAEATNWEETETFQEALPGSNRY